MLPATYDRSFALSRQERKASQEIDRIRLGSQVAAAREAAKVEAIADVARTALMETGELSALEGFLARRTPHAVPRLQYVADAAATGMAGVVVRMASRL